MTDSDNGQLVTSLQEAHQDTAKYTEMLANARQRRRELAAQLHLAGRSYRWIGDKIGVTAQAVEGLVKYHQRKASPARRKGEERAVDHRSRSSQ